MQIQRCKKSDTSDIFDLVRAYPNPAAAAFSVDISLNETQNVLITLSDINGRKISSQLLTEQPWYQVQYSDLSTGVYFIHVQGETKAVVLKVLVF